MKTERIFTANLKLDTALHVGTGKGGMPTDSPLRRSADGRLLLPGPALAGSLRTVVTRLAPRLSLVPCKALKTPERNPTPCLCPVCQLFGDLYPDEKDNAEQGGAASRVWIYDAFVQAEPMTHIRDGVGIGRSTGAAARQVKFDYEVVPRETTFKFRVRLVDDDSKAADARAMLIAAALAEWEAGRGRLGGGAARGLGRFHLEELTCLRARLSTSDDLVAYLRAGGDREEISQAEPEWQRQALQAARSSVKPLDQTGDLPVARGFVTVSFILRLDGPFVANDPLVGMLAGFDHAPLVEFALGHDDRAGRPVLSGASLRGALRSRAEKIARTLGMLQSPTRAEFFKHCPACDPLGESCDARMTIPDEVELPSQALCLGCRLFGSPRRGSRLWVEDAYWAGPSLGPDAWKAQDFLAIDRFTGGGQEHAKFDAAALVGARFDARLTLHDPRDWELGWLTLALRDLAEGELTVGFGAAKGYGRATASDFCWSAGYLHDHDLSWRQLLMNPRPSGVFQVAQASGAQGSCLPQTWVETAQGWLDKFKQEIQSCEWPEDQQPAQDSFFDADGQLPALYGLPRGRIAE